MPFFTGFALISIALSKLIGQILRGFHHILLMSVLKMEQIVDRSSKQANLMHGFKTKYLRNWDCL